MVHRLNTDSTGKSGLRTKFSPKNRIGHGLVAVAPWIDVLLLMLCFVILESKFVLQRGTLIELPVSTSTEAFRSDMVAVVRSFEAGETEKRKEIIFFDDERFLVDSESQMERLKTAFSEYTGKHAESGLLLYADQSVSQGTIIRLFNMARDSGVVKVNIAARSESAVK